MTATLREADIQRAILDYLAAERIFAIRMNTLVLRNAANRPVRSHSAGAGMADILAFLNVWCGEVLYIAPLWIEVKRPKAVQSPLQRSFQAKVEYEGHTYCCATSVDDVIAAVKRITS